jgi:hypothetical protein
MIMLTETIAPNSPEEKRHLQELRDTLIMVNDINRDLAIVAIGQEEMLSNIEENTVPTAAGELLDGLGERTTWRARGSEPLDGLGERTT